MDFIMISTSNDSYISQAYPDLQELHLYLLSKSVLLILKSPYLQVLTRFPDQEDHSSAVKKALKIPF